MAILGDTKAVSLTLLDGVIGNLNPKTTGIYDLGTSSLKWNNIYGTFKGNADTATTLETARTIWGQSFDGSGDISGSMTNVGPTMKLPSGSTAFGFYTSSGGAANINAGRLGLNSSFSDISLTNYVLDVKGKTRIRLPNSASSNKDFTIVDSSGYTLSIGGQGIQAYGTNGTSTSTLNLQYYGGNVQIGTNNTNPTLTLGKLTITGGSTDSTISTTGTLYLNSAASNNIIFTKGGTDNEMARFDESSNFVPKSGLNNTIGTSTNKWKEIYADNLRGNADTATGISTSGGSAAKFWRGDNTWSDTISGGTLKITNNNNTLTIGSANSSFCHFQNNANIPFHFNRLITDSIGFDIYTTNNSWRNGYLKINNKDGGNTYLELARESNADWKILNSGGNLYFQSDYTTAKTDYFNVLTLNYNTGNATFKGSINAGGDLSTSGTFSVANTFKAQRITFNMGDSPIGHGWRRICKVSYMSAYQQWFLGITGQYQYSYPTGALIGITSVFDSLNPILLSCQHNVNGSHIDLIRFVNITSNQYWLDIHCTDFYNGNGDPVKTWGNIHFLFYGNVTVSDVQSSTARLDDDDDNDYNDKIGIELSLRTMKDQPTFTLRDKNGANQTTSIFTHDDQILTLPSTIEASLTGTVNDITLTAATTGFTISGGTTSKTLTVKGDIALNSGSAAGRIAWYNSKNEIQSAPTMHINWTAGTITATGSETLVIGNGMSSTTDGNARGLISIYSSGTHGTSIVAADNSTAWYTATLPAKTGTIAYTSDITALSIGNYAPLASPELTGSPTITYTSTPAATTNSNLIATTSFVQSAINNKLAANDAMLFKGTLGTGGTITSVPNGSSNQTYQAGYTYRVITAGTYAGYVCEIGDLLIAIKDSTSGQNSVQNGHWTVAQTNIDGAVTGPAESVANQVPVFNSDTGKVITNSNMTYSNRKLTIPISSSSGATEGICIARSAATGITAREIMLTMGTEENNANAGLYDKSKGKWIAYSNKDGKVTLNGNANTTTAANLTTTVNAIARYSDTAGTFADSKVTIDDNGYLSIGTASGTVFPTGGIHIWDTRTEDFTPGVLDKGANFFFTNQNIPSGYTWGSGIYVRGWSGSNYAAWCLIGPANGSDYSTTPLYVRTSKNGTEWGTYRKIYDTSNKPTPSEIGAATSILSTSNTMVWTDGSKNIVSGNHYVTTDKVAINSASAPSQNFYVNGTSYLNGNSTIGGNITSYSTVILSASGNPWPKIRFDTRASSSGTYTTTAQEEWGDIFCQVPSKKNSDNTYYKTRIFFRQYSQTANTTTRSGGYETYYLPAVTDNLATNTVNEYSILTTKNLSFNITGTAANVTGTVTTAHGGTGTTTAPTQGGIIYASSTSSYASTAAGNVNQVLVSNGTSAAPTWRNDRGIEYIRGAWTAASATWTGTTQDAALYEGKQIILFMPFAGTSTAATLNLTLNGAAVGASGSTTTGAKNVYFESTTRFTTHKGQYSQIHLIYHENHNINGTNYTGWWYVANRDTTTTNATQIQFNSTGIKAGGSAIVAYNIITANENGLYQHLKSGNKFDITYPILYASAAINANATSTSVYSEINFTVTTTQSISLTAHKPVYIKGTLSGKLCTPISTAPLTQTLPSTDDGYVYIYLGYAYGTTAIRLQTSHPIYWYKDGKIQLYNAYATAASELNYYSSSYLADANDPGVNSQGLTLFKVDNESGTGHVNTQNNPGGNSNGYDGTILHFSFSSTTDWSSQLFIPDYTANDGGWHMKWRAHSGATTWSDWKTILDSSNTTAPSTVPTLNWNEESTVFTLNGTAVKVKAMPKPTYSDVGAAAASHSHNVITGSYTGSGGQQNPNYFGTNKVGFLMMNTAVNNNSQYKDWIIMDCYNANDVGGGVAFGVNRQSLGAYIMRSDAGRASWAESAELIGTHNYTSYTVTKTGTGASGTWGINVSGTAAKLIDISSTDAASSTATWRRIWFSYDNNVTGRPAYSDNFVYQTSTGTLKTMQQIIGNKVLLQYNSNDESLDFVFV